MEGIFKQSDIINLLHPGIQKLIQDKNWRTGFTDIQVAAIPSILDGVDCIIEAPTAGGKTEAVLFPTFTKVSQSDVNSVQVLYLAPLKALLNDIEFRAREYAEACGLHCFKWHGDVSQKAKIEEFNQPSQVLLTTPESLEAIILRKAGWIKFFDNLQTVIIDEAHNFADVDRGCHLISLLERLESKLDKLPQRVAITATIGNPDEMLKWLAGGNHKIGKRIFVPSSKDKKKDYQIQFFFDNSENIKNEIPSSYRRLLALYNLLPMKKSIIFGGSRNKCESIATAINQLNSVNERSIPVKVRTHHSSVSKYYREEAEKRIKIKNDLESGIDSIISTSTLELGIDIGQLDQIIQLDSLSSSSSFLQRVGRTGRRDNKPQFFRGLCVHDEDLALLSGVVSLGLKGISENLHFPRQAIHILAHQIICLSLQNNGVRKSHAWQILSRAYCFSKITEEQFCDLVSFMIAEKFIRDIDGELVVGESTERLYLGANWQKLFSVFDSGPLYEVYDEKKHIGNLDEAFVESLDVPFLFVLGGLEWEAYKVNTEAKQVFAQKTSQGNAPRWLTFQGFDVPFETAKEVGQILFSDSLPTFLNEEAKSCVESLKQKVRNLYWCENYWILTTSLDIVKVWSFAGDKINRTLSKLIDIAEFGVSSSDYKSVTIKFQTFESRINVNDTLNFLNKLKNISFDQYSEFFELLVCNTNAVYFSKFSKCLSEDQIRYTLVEKLYDLNGLIKQLNNIEFITKIDS